MNYEFPHAHHPDSSRTKRDEIYHGNRKLIHIGLAHCWARNIHMYKCMYFDSLGAEWDYGWNGAGI